MREYEGAIAAHGQLGEIYSGVRRTRVGRPSGPAESARGRTPVAGGSEAQYAPQRHAVAR